MQNHFLNRLNFTHILQLNTYFEFHPYEVMVYVLKRHLIITKFLSFVANK